MVEPLLKQYTRTFGNDFIFPNLFRGENISSKIFKKPSKTFYSPSFVRGGTIVAKKPKSLGPMDPPKAP